MDVPALPLLGSLAVLALLDSTSLGTLGLPVWMLSRRRVRVGGIVVFLLTLGAFYWLLGILLFTVLGAALPTLRVVGDSTPVVLVQLGVGVALFLASFLFDGPGGRWRRRRRERSGRPSRMQRWQERAAGPDQHLSTVVGLALAAGALEAASMVPYLAALALLTTTGTPWVQAAGLLLAYVVVMVGPALVLLALRVLLARQVEPLLARLSAWFSSSADGLLAWTLGIAGFLLATDALQRLQR